MTMSIKNNLNSSAKDNKFTAFTNVSRDTIRIVMLGCIAILLALLVMSITGMVITKNAVVHKLKTRDLQNMAGTISATIEGRIEKAVDASLLLSKDPMLKHWIRSNDQDEASREIVEGKLKELVADFGYDTAFLTSAISYNYWSYTGGEFKLLNVVSPHNPADGWFFDTLEMQRKYAINIDPNEVLQETFVWINVLVGDLENPIAITGVGLNLSHLINDLIKEEAEQELDSDIWLVDNSGTIHLSKNKSHLERELNNYLSQDLVDNITEQNLPVTKFQVAEYHNHEGKLYDVVYKNIKDTDWKLIIQIPRSESLGFLNVILINTIIAGLIIVTLMMAMFYGITKKIANPYKRTLELNLELEEQVAERTKELKKKNLEIQESIEYAKLIQETILPSQVELKELLQDHFVIWKPRDIVGGDFYWLRSYKDGFLLLLGDCTGHGVPGALMTMAVNSMLNHIVEDIGHDDPAFILKELNRRMKNSFSGSNYHEHINPGLDALILFITKEGSIFLSSSRLSAIVIDEEGVKEIKGDRVTIDGQEYGKKGELTNKAIKYHKRISLYLTTDGYTDQPGGDKGLPMGKKKLMHIVKEINHLPMEEQRLKIEELFLKHSENQTIRDDITIIGFTINKQRS
ncbi:SpoIIE family protein phosphatase [Candidatus Contubernalis alkaliaceticus]|uniref:SpoIIE family protein phosphatase n=1 Tax=Candidatus Contubernalis alkaliaceticus TaxID=338645 RepID=UPI001F4BE3E3|nr:SpoIIE family protein phosphatase [Candidatus Contubernalis alkalaceticus]UNC90807.1 SpoIIE family protein phosphatase [Candidatus Contubernalis alkalaceticus]